MRRLAKNRVVVIGLVSATVLGLLLAVVGSRLLARTFALPADAELLDIASLLSGAPPVTDEGDGEGAASTPVRRPTARPKSKESFVIPIVKRSIFDSTKVDQGVVAGPEGECPKTDLNLVLYATIVAQPDTFSSALIGEPKSDQYPTGYGVGDEIQGKKIYAIEQKNVVFLSGSDYECLRVEGEENRVSRAPGAGSDVVDDGDNKFSVDESLLQEALANPEALATQIRAVPHKGSDGNIDGYRLSGIRKDSFFEKLGVKNGDIIHSVNGKELTSVSNAMDAYQSLQSERAFTFEVTRKGTKQTMQYEVN